MRAYFLIYLVLPFALMSALGCSSEPQAVEEPLDVIVDDVGYLADALLPEDFPLRVGHYWPAGSPFSELVDEQDMEIVQGFQGGVHTEIALEIDLGLDYAEVQILYIDLLAQTYLEDGGLVAQVELANFKAGNLGFGVFRSQTIPIVFEQNEATHYVDRDAHILVRVSLEGKVSARAIPLRLIDTGDETLSAEQEI